MNNHLVTTVACCLLAMLLLGACRDDSNAPSATLARAGSTADTSIPPNMLPKPSPIDIPEKVASDLAKGSSDEVRQVLITKRLSFEDYRSSVLAMADCIRRSDPGVSFAFVDDAGEAQPTSGPLLNKRWRFEFGFLYKSDGVDHESHIQTCKSQHVGVLERLWAERTAATKAELDEARTALIDCMRSLGDGIAIGSPPEAFRQYMQHPTAAYDTCTRRIAKDFALPGFSGA